MSCFEQFPGEMRDRAGARRCIRQLFLMALCVGDELAQVFRRNARMHDDGRGRRRNHRHRREVLCRIVRRMQHQIRRDDLRAGIAEQERIAVGPGMSDGGSADRAAAAAFVLDNDGPDRPAYALSPIARDRIDHAARRIWHDQADGFLRIFRLRESGCAAKRSGRKRCDSEANTITAIHCTFLPARFLCEPRRCLPDRALRRPSYDARFCLTISARLPDIGGRSSRVAIGARTRFYATPGIWSRALTRHAK